MTTLPVATVAVTARVGVRTLWRRPVRLIGAGALLILSAAAMLLVPLLLGAIVDAVIVGDPFERILMLSAGLLGAGLTSVILDRIGGFLLVQCLQYGLSQLREDVFDVAVALPLSAVEDAGDADIISRVTGDVEAVADAVAGVFPLALRAAFTIVLTVIGLAVLDPWLAAAALLAVPLQIFTTRKFLKRSRTLYTRLRHQEAERGRAVIEAVAGAPTVRALSAQQHHLADIAESSQVAIDTELAAVRARNGFYGGLNAAEFIGLGAVLVVGFIRVSTVGLAVGAVTAGALFFHRLFDPVGTLLTSLDDLQRALTGLQRLVGVLSLTESASRPGIQIEDSTVSLRRVDYRYGADAPRWAVREVDLDVPAGTTLALIGTSGSGKSTLARLVAGLDDPVRGEVLIGNVPATAARHHDRPAVFLVSQEAHVFLGSVADNVRLARPEAKDHEVAEALAAVGLEAELAIDETPADDGNHRVAQQIALARVLLANPAVVVLDEAGAQAGADPVLATAMATVTRQRTAIIIAHHLDQVRAADMIAVLEDGVVHEWGSSAELLSRPDSAFRRLWDASRLSE